ncbi:flavin reductase family protein [Mycolicibacterium sp.]|uniref:flavin reductase family protein n=1 Tax=Mycolicibacterium sp. TaxID=2320850 RepID=UPI001A2CAE22|nr:flavin reductase family protein [Mycolicibacterium sp.]MBJ7337571.1 flavin reductase family protein [Mycolicibacterium sp.]
MSTVSYEEYRAALRRHPAGVAVITLMSSSGPVGFTATSFASLSLDPPLVCFNITHTSSSIAALREATSMVVHLLGEDQLDVAQRFSRSAEHRFADETLWTTLDTGEPVVAGTPTWLRTTVQQLIPAGDSTLVIAHVADIHRDDSVGTPAPLLYHDGIYRQFSRRATPMRSPARG